ncbi:CG8642, partial [Drosophila busckii]
EKNDQYEKLQTKLQQRETTIKSLESKANANKEALSNWSEDKLKAEKETLKLPAKITELQTKLAEALKKGDQLKDSLTNERDKRIAEIEEQLSCKEHENKLLKDELTRQKDRAEATSCLPFGSSSDIETIRLPGVDPFLVPCDSKFAGNGWTVIQRRVDDSVSFDRNWEEYKNGFGDLRGNFWLGLEKLHLMTKLRPHELYIQLEDFNNETRYARYTNFTIGNEAQSYELISVGNYTGNAGDALDSGDRRGAAKNMKFSTPERDNDKSHMNCAAFYASGWWFNNCHACNLNGGYVNTRTDKDNPNGIEWRTWHLKPLKFVQMMIRP